MSTIRTRVSVAAMIAALTLSAPLQTALALPSPGDPGVTAANRENGVEPRLRLSNAGFDAWRKVRAARIAIFNGDPALATDYIADAKQDLAEARKNENDDYVQKTSVTVGDQTLTRHWYPVDGAIAVLDDFATKKDEAKATAAGHVGKANKHLVAGEHEEAMNELKRAGVDVSYTRMLLPLEKFEAEVVAADDFAKEGKFFEANLALKRAEDSMRSDTVMLMQTPKAEASN